MRMSEILLPFQNEHHQQKTVLMGITPSPIHVVTGDDMSIFKQGIARARARYGGLGLIPSTQSCHPCLSTFACPPTPLSHLSNTEFKGPPTPSV